MKDENPFKDKLYQHTMPVREEVWQAIEQKLPEKEDRKLPVFWFVLFASALIGGSLMLGYVKRDTAPQQPVPQDSARTHEVQPDLSAADPSTFTVQPVQSSTSAINRTDDFITVPTTAADNPGSVENSTADILSNANAARTKTEAKNAITTSSKITSTHSLTQNTHVSNSTATLVSNATPSNRSAASTPVAGKTTTGIKNTSDASSIHAGAGITSTTSASSTSTSSPASTSQSTISESTTVTENYVTPAIKRTTRITTLIPSLNSEVENMDMLLAELSAIRPDPTCYKFSSKGGQYFFSADFFSGPGWSPRTFSDPDGNATVYSIARKTTESSLYAWSAGARFNMHLHNGFAIRLGILYDQAGDIFDYTDTLATRSITRIDSFFNADGSFLRAETIRVLEFGTLIKRINNTYRHLDVPILLSYERPIGRTSLMINAGPVFNLTASHHGQILDPMLIPRHITPAQANPLSAYKTSLGMSFYLGAGIVFPLTEHFAGVVEPRYLYRIKPVTLKSYPLEERRHYAGMNIGLRYFFK
jgi:hypothetical protein